MGCETVDLHPGGDPKHCLSHYSMRFADVKKQFGDTNGEKRIDGNSVEEGQGKLLLTIDWRFVFIRLNGIWKYWAGQTYFVEIIGLTSGSRQCYEYSRDINPTTQCMAVNDLNNPKELRFDFTDDRKKVCIMDGIMLIHPHGKWLMSEKRRHC